MAITAICVRDSVGFSFAVAQKCNEGWHILSSGRENGEWWAILGDDMSHQRTVQELAEAVVRGLQYTPVNVAGNVNVSGYVSTGS
jgi:hypothetical protein